MIPIFREIRADLDTPLSIYLKLSKIATPFLLESITGGENLARYSIIGTNPKKIIKTGDKEELGNIDPLKNKRMKSIVIKSLRLKSCLFLQEEL